MLVKFYYDFSFYKVNQYNKRQIILARSDGDKVARSNYFSVSTFFVDPLSEMYA